MAKRRFATSLLAGCLLTTCLGTSAFAGEPEHYFYPTQKWTVAKQGGDDSAPTCALSNSFNNGFIIKISGNSAGFEKLDIDFRQSTFTPGKKYEIVYSVPGNAREVFQAKAPAGSVLSASLESKADFSKALQSAATLDMSIQSNQFRLYLTGFAKALDSYNNCIHPPGPDVAAIDEVENPPELAAVPEEDIVPAPSEESLATAKAPPAISSPPEDESPILSEEEQKADKKDILAKINSLAHDYEASNSKASALPEPEEAESTASSAEIPEGDISDAIPQEEDAPAAPPAARERYTEKLARQLKEQSEQYKPASSSSSSNPSSPGPAALPPRPYNSEDAEEAEQTQAPKNEVIHFNGERILPEPKTDSSSAQIEEPKPEAEHVSVKIPAYKMTKQTTKMEADFTKIPEEAPAADDSAPLIEASVQSPSPAMIEPGSGDSDDFIQMRQKVRDLEEQVLRLRKENSMLDDELKTSLKDSEEERLSVSSDNWNLERATMRYNEAERQIKRLGRELQTARQQCSQEKDDLKSMLFDPQVTEQQQLAKLSSLEQELADAKSDLQSVQRKYEERIRLLEGQLSAQ